MQNNNGSTPLDFLRVLVGDRELPADICFLGYTVDI